ncbi:hypothetical protein NFI96_015159, partial [Prochilodus magdalenae]
SQCEGGTMTSKMSSTEEQDTQTPERLDQGKRSDSPEPSCVSMKSDQSEDRFIDFRKETRSTEFRLAFCSITEEGFASLISALKSNPSHLRELNLSRNKPGESGVKLLSDLLEVPHCKLEKLALSECSITEEGCAALLSSLKSNPSHLRELNLNYSRPGESGMKLLSDLLADPHCKLETLELCKCSITEEGCATLVSSLKSNPSHLRELNLNYSRPGESGVKLLSDLLEDPQCKLKKLQHLSTASNCQSPNSAMAKTKKLSRHQLSRHQEENCRPAPGWEKLSECSITEEDCAALVSALKLNPSHLKELNLNYSRPGETGVKLLSDLLADPQCKLEKLHLSDCSITEKGCAALVSALKSNPSHLRELNLSWNNPGKSGVKLLSDLLEDPHCKLEKLE